MRNFCSGGGLMNSGKSIFAQLMDFLPSKAFRRCVKRYRGDYKLQTFSCWDQFLCMAFAQLTYRESLRDIEACLRAQQTKLYHLGIRGQVSRNTLAHANSVRDWRIYADFAQVLITRARVLYADDSFGVELAQTVYALDATTIDLCLALFPWAEFRKKKGAVKLHTPLDLRGNIPTVVIITHGKVHEVNMVRPAICRFAATAEPSRLEKARARTCWIYPIDNVTNSALSVSTQRRDSCCTMATKSR